MHFALSSLFLFVAAGGSHVTDAQTTDDGTDFRVCGLNYTHVIDNCNDNPKCPTGDNCPVGFTCYQLSEALCPPPGNETNEPTPATPAIQSFLPTFASTSNLTSLSTFSICAASFAEAQDSCFDATKSCAACDNVTEACFVVNCNTSTGEENVTDPTEGAETAPPTGASIVTATSSTTSSITSSAANTPSPSQPSFPAPTTAPVVNRYFCGTSWEDAEKNCTTATPCPNGQQECTTAGTSCFQIQEEKCQSVSSSPSSLGAGSSSNAPTTLSSSDSSFSASQSAGEKVRVCAADPVEAAFKCNVNPACPDGSTELCDAGQTCFELDSCMASSNSDVPTPGPSSSSGNTFGTKAPSPIAMDQTNSTAKKTPAPTGIVGFEWTPPAPSGSSMPNVNFVLRFVLVGGSLLGSALAIF